jgi:cytochrome c553
MQTVGNVAMHRLVAACLAIACIAGTADAAGNAEKGKALAKSWDCFECHGLSGNDRSTQEFPVPMLAGQPAAFLAGRLWLYRTLDRPEDASWTRMRTYALGLDDADAAHIAAWYAAQKRY